MSVDPQDQSGPFAPTDPLQTVNEVVFDSEVSMVGGTDTA